MRRVYSRSELSDSEGDGQAEQDLAKLQRQYRLLEGNRKQYDTEAQNAIRRQRAAIEALQKESEELLKDFKLASSRKNSGKDTKHMRQMVTLQSKQDEYDEQIQAEKAHFRDLEKEIRAMERKISQHHKQMGGVHMSQQQQVRIRKQVRVLENRLDKALVKFNSALANNSQLRKNIDHLRQEKMVFDQIYCKLEQTLSDIKRQLGELIETSIQAYDTRDEARGKMLALRERADKELAQHTMDMKELMRAIDYDRKLNEFMAVKDFERLEMEEAAQQQRRLKGEGEKGDKAEETLETYEAAFTKIMQVAEIDDIDKLVARFIEVEDENFALFNFVNELNNDKEVLNEQIAEVKSNIENFKTEGQNMEQQRKSIMTDLEKQLQSVEREMKHHEMRHAQNSKVLDQLKSGVDSLFTKIDCDRSAITDLLGGQAGITDLNLMQFLGIIEQRVNELLHLQTFILLKEQEDAATLQTTSSQVHLPTVHKPLPQIGAITVVPPATGDDYESDVSSVVSDDESRPLTQEELKAKILRELARKEKMPQKTAASAASEKAPLPGKPTKTPEKGRKKAVTKA